MPEHEPHRLQVGLMMHGVRYDGRDLPKLVPPPRAPAERVPGRERSELVLVEGTLGLHATELRDVCDSREADAAVALPAERTVDRLLFRAAEIGRAHV